MTLAAIAPLRLGRVSLVRVRRHEEWLARRYLSDDELALRRRLAVDKRRVDFVAGRIAAKRALAVAGDPRRVCVLPATGARAGAPRVHRQGGELDLALSISHGAGWAVAVAADDGALAVGIDVERVEPRHPSFAAEAFADGELSRWADALGAAPQDARVVTVAWCAKEALLKLDGSGLRATLPAVAPEAVELYGGTGDGLTRGRLSAGALGECRLALEVDDARALVIVWSTTRRT